MEILQQPWPWYIAGPIIGLMVPLLLFLANKHFGVSSSMKHLCASCVPVKPKYFKYNWRSEMWNLVLILGVIIGGFIGGQLLSNNKPVQIAQQTKDDLGELGISDFSGLIPAEIFSWENLFSLQGIILIIVGGFLVGFGSRYANGCTSGHAIMGLSLLNPGSLIAVIGFFIGGLITTFLLLPLVLGM